MSTFRAQHLSSAEKEDERRSCRTLTPCQMSVSFSRIRDERTLSALAPVGNSADTPLSNPPIKLDRFQPTHTHNGKREQGQPVRRLWNGEDRSGWCLRSQPWTGQGACDYLRRHWASRQDTPWTECQPITGHTHILSHSLTQSRDANQPTMHVFGLGEETGAPGGNPQGTGRTCKLHTHGGGGNRTPNPGGVRQ
ncbi:hypothetical protein QTP70_028684, partial [Hemibagrus guttatus]